MEQIKEVDIKEEKQIEDFIDWLRYFFVASRAFTKGFLSELKDSITEKEKENEKFANWLNSIRDFDFDMQDKLINELRYANW